MILLFLNILSCLHLKELHAELSHMHSFSIPTNGVFEYNVLMNRYNINGLSTAKLCTLYNQDEDFIGQFLYFNNKINNVSTEYRFITLDDSYVKNEVTNSSGFKLSNIVDLKYFDNNNKFNYILTAPEVKKNNERNTFIMEIPEFKIEQFIKAKFLQILLPLIKNNTLMTVINCKNLIRNIKFSMKDDLFCHIYDKKYIFPLFKNDYTKIVTFLKNIINMLYSNSILTENNIIELFEKKQNELIDEGVIEEWECYFSKLNITDINEKKVYIALMLLNDTINLLKLSEDPNYKFVIYSFNSKKVRSIGKPIVLATVDRSNLEIDSFNNVIIISDKNQNVEYSKSLCIANKILYYFDLDQLKSKKIKWIKIAYLTPKGRFETVELKIKYD